MARNCQFWSLMLAFSATAALAAGQQTVGGSGGTTTNPSLTLRFYQQFLLNATGTPSQYTVVPAVGPNRMGQMEVFDAAITRDEQLSLTSGEIGRAHGVVIYDDLEQPAWENVWTAVFNDRSSYPNSSISFRGYQPSTDVADPQPWTYAIVGGSGVFRCAKGTVSEEVVSVTDSLQTILNILAIILGC